ncbi:MAG: hypothetical protein P1P90_04425 [Patescibacteria group bacterium]|nr:hypothetical protein [Patescibacteria group bacterium]
MSFWQKLFGKKEEKDLSMESSADMPVSAPTPPPAMEESGAESTAATEPAPEAPAVETEDVAGGKSW